jgi:hypothetical protein
MDDIHIAFDKLGDHIRDLTSALAAAVARAERAEAQLLAMSGAASLQNAAIADCISARDTALARVREVEAERDRAVAKVREAVRIAGEKLHGKDITEQEVNSVADLIMREEHCIGWMTTDEMEAAQADVQIRDDQIEDLTRKLAAARAEAVREFAEWCDQRGVNWIDDFESELALFLASRPAPGTGLASSEDEKEGA